jgi:Zn-dependent peptidase ImmA (M78 family)
MKQVTMSLPVTDPRAHVLRDRFHAVFAADKLPAPVEAIAEDLLGLHIDEAEIDCSGMLLPAERRVVLRADEPPARRRFTLAHEVGHWVCQVREGHDAPVYCRAADIAPGADRLLEREANVFAAELLMPEPAVQVEWSRAESAAEVATWFGVSEEAMSWRLFNLGLLPKRPSATAIE